jgi:hypothetical protein
MAGLARLAAQRARRSKGVSAPAALCLPTHSWWVVTAVNAGANNLSASFLHGSSGPPFGLRRHRRLAKLWSAAGLGGHWRQQPGGIRSRLVLPPGDSHSQRCRHLLPGSMHQPCPSDTHLPSPAPATARVRPLPGAPFMAVALVVCSTTLFWRPRAQHGGQEGARWAGSCQLLNAPGGIQRAP